MENKQCTDRDDIFLIPFRVAELEEHEDREEDIESELEGLKVRSSHRCCRSRGENHSPSLNPDIIEREEVNKYSQPIRNAPSSLLTPTMALSKHVHPDRLIQEAKDKPSGHSTHSLTGHDPGALANAYGGRYGTSSTPKYKIPSTVRLRSP